MTTNDQDRILEVLDDRECRRLLSSAHLGRLGFTDGALPAIVPVPFALEEDSLVIPARHDHWVVRAMRGSVVAFAVDCYDVDVRTGWGVTVIGPSRVVPQPGLVVLDAPVRTVLPQEKGQCTIVVRLGLLRGWRLSLPAVSASGICDAAAAGGVTR